MSSSRYEQICIYKKNICTICHSKYCKGDIRIKNKGGVTTIKCNEYNVKRKKCN